jgi:ElaB/YqjD/DUF883 family membrane-anchored ribosome-binding protein|tara:strand:- start:1623 stop:1856 length:234 start_codon:yes stop_codon:yes gene_type:complete
MDTLDQLKKVRTDRIRKEAEIESVAERLEALLDKTGDDAHRARTKLRHERERLLEMKCKEAELEIDVEAMRLASQVS